MKNILYALVFISVLVSVSCEENRNKFSGSPVDSGVLITDIVCTVSTPEIIVSSVQNFDYTVTLPKTFNYDVKAEVTVVAENLSLRRSVVVIPAGTTSATGTLSAPVAVDSDSSLGNYLSKCALSATALYPVEGGDGTIYNVKSNIVNLKLSDTSVPLSRIDRFIITFDCKGPWGTLGNPLNNSLDLIVKKDGTVFAAAIPPSTALQVTNKPNTRSETFSIMDSFADGDYRFSTYFPVLISNGNLECRIVLVYPTNKVKTVEFNAVNTGPSTAANAFERLVINKKTNPTTGNITYTPTFL